MAVLNEAGIGGVSVLGHAGESVCQIAVGLNRVGEVLMGELTAEAVEVEAGSAIVNIAESGMIDFQRLQSFWQL